MNLTRNKITESDIKDNSILLQKWTFLKFAFISIHIVCDSTTFYDFKSWFGFYFEPLFGYLISFFCWFTKKSLPKMFGLPGIYFLVLNLFVIF